MIARDNDTRAALNTAARELWRALGLLGEASLLRPVEMAVGDRVICRRNDRLIDVDNGMRGTVRHVDGDRVVIDTDSGLVRELPGRLRLRAPRARLLADRSRHAGRDRRDSSGGGLSPGSHRRLELHRALPRAGRDAPSDPRPPARRGPRASSHPRSSPRRSARGDLLARVQRHMLERDDEDLAIEQLPGAGRADDPELAGSRELAGEPSTGAGSRPGGARAAGRGDPGAAA